MGCGVEDELDEDDAETSRDKNNSKDDRMIVNNPNIGLEIIDSISSCIPLID